MKVLAFLIFSALTDVASAATVEIWECQQESYGNWSSILVVASVEEGRRSGTIDVAGVTHRAQFSVEGFDRRWDFGTKEDPVRFSFVVKPNGVAHYFDFRDAKTAKPSNFMFCRQRKTNQS